MYIECNAESLNGPARIGRVTFSRTLATLYYEGKSFQSLKGGYKANYFDLETREEYWISGPRRMDATGFTKATCRWKSMWMFGRNIGPRSGTSRRGKADHARDAMSAGP
jgi:hypothetical protein